MVIGSARVSVNVRASAGFTVTDTEVTEGTGSALDRGIEFVLLEVLRVKSRFVAVRHQQGIAAVWIEVRSLIGRVAR